MNTPQEAAWLGEFGDRYTDRNIGRVPANRHFFRKALAAAMPTVNSVLELGCGAGENLTAMRQLMPAAHLEGVEINATAARIAREHGHLVREVSVLDYRADRKYDLILSKGFCIHVPPTELHRVYELMVSASARWILIAEYYNPTPVEIPYRGQQGMMWKRDWAGDLLAAYKELRLTDYSFTYHRDPYPQDDLTAFLLRKEPAC